jgi:hypothetical protein
MKHDMIVHMQAQLPCGCVVTSSHTIDAQSLDFFVINDFNRSSAAARDSLRAQVLEHECHAPPQLPPPLELVPLTKEPARSPGGRVTFRADT